MVFSSLFFVLFFFVACYTVYFFMDTTRKKNIVLLVSSLIFYAWSGPGFVLLLAGMTLVCYIGALRIRYKGHPKRDLVWTIAICLFLLCFFKYTTFLLSNLRLLTGIPKVVPKILLPIGISFYTFQLISYVVDVYRKEIPPQKNYAKLLLYASLFHQCIAGPIVRYKDIQERIDNRTTSLAEISRGITRFCIGLSKKAILANYCGALTETILPMTSVAQIRSFSALQILLGSICFMLQIYLDFSAYSDMAIGMGLMVGFHYPENFTYPYMADSITGFWRRWHITLSRFFRDYVYIPLGGNRCSVPRHIFNLFVVWALTGIWHGANWNFLLWGLFFFVFLCLEKFVFKFKEDPHGIERLLRRFYTLAVVCFSFMLFRFEDLRLLKVALAGLFCGNGNKFADSSVWMYFKNNILFLLAAVLACTPVVPLLHQRWHDLSQTSRASRVLERVSEVVLPVLLLLLSIASLAGDSYNPFLYLSF